MTAADPTVLQTSNTKMREDALFGTWAITGSCNLSRKGTVREGICPSIKQLKDKSRTGRLTEIQS